METASLRDFYREIGFTDDNELSRILPEGVTKDIGHFNVFGTAAVRKTVKQTRTMPYNRRTYYKISLINGHNRAEYADKVIDIKKHGLLFASPKIPYNYIPQDEEQSGSFCIFTHEFLASSHNGMRLDELPIFKPGGYPVFQLNETQAAEVEAIFDKMFNELDSDYAFKYDLLRNYVMELIHYGQKLQPDITQYTSHTASARVTGLFCRTARAPVPGYFYPSAAGIAHPKGLRRKAGHPCKPPEQGASRKHRAHYLRFHQQPDCPGSKNTIAANGLECFGNSTFPGL